MPVKQAAEARNVFFSVRLNQSEHDLLTRLAERTRQSRGEVIRGLLANAYPEAEASHLAQLAEFARRAACLLETMPKAPGSARD